MSDKREWVIRKRGYFYRSNRAGYTSSISEAGRYTQADAMAEERVEPMLIKAHLACEFEYSRRSCHALKQRQ